MAAMCPAWMSTLDRCIELEQIVRAKIERLQALQKEHMTPRFTTSEAEGTELAAIEKQSKDISKLVKELDRMIETGIRPTGVTNPDEMLAASNVQKHLAARLNSLINDFKDGQTLFAEQLKRREEKTKKFKHLGTPEVQQRLEKEEKIAGYQEMGYSQVEIHELLAMEAQAHETNREAQEILASVKELYELFSDMRNLIVEQGTVLDRIDYNVDQASIKIKAGLGQLRKAREEQKKCAVS